MSCHWCSHCYRLVAVVVIFVVMDNVDVVVFVVMVIFVGVFVVVFCTYIGRARRKYLLYHISRTSCQYTFLYSRE